MSGEVEGPSGPIPGHSDETLSLPGARARLASSGEEIAIRAPWTISDYENLLSELTRIAPIVGSYAYSSGELGIWLRHDVELDAEAALAIAHSEQRLGLSSTFYVCADSPFLCFDDVRLLLPRLRDMGHEVGLHRRWNVESDEARWHLLGFTPDETRNGSFHAPGVPAAELETHAAGARVYANLSKGIGSYASDSTGRWRWGTPDQALAKGLPLQVLTHPFWWSGGKKDLQSMGTLWPTFLPQLAGLQGRNGP